VTVTLGKHGALFSWQLAGGSGQIMSHYASLSFVVIGISQRSEMRGHYKLIADSSRLKGKTRPIEDSGFLTDS